MVENHFQKFFYIIYFFQEGHTSQPNYSFHFSRASLNQLIFLGGQTLNNYINIFIMKKKKFKAREKEGVLANLSILYCIGSVD